AGGDHTVRLWDVAGGHLRLLLRGHGRPVRAVSFHPHGRYLASCGEDGTVKVWDVTQHPEYEALPAPAGADCAALAFAAGGRSVLAGGGGTLRAQEVRTGLPQGDRPVDLLGEWLVPATKAAFSADGARLVTVSGRNPSLVKVWDVASGREVAALPGPDAKV